MGAGPANTETLRRVGGEGAPENGLRQGNRPGMFHGGYPQMIDLCRVMTGIRLYALLLLLGGFCAGCGI